MTKCIYSLKENVESNEEHIVPAFLGGKKCLPLGWVSKEANDRFSKIEAECSLYPIFSLMREFVGPGKRGSNIVPTLKKYHVINVIDSDEYSIGYIFNGKPHLVPSVIINLDNNSVRFEMDAKDKEHIYSNFMLVKKMFREKSDKYIKFLDGKIPPNIVILGIDNNKKIIAISNDEVFIDNKTKIEVMISKMNIMVDDKLGTKVSKVSAVSHDIIKFDILNRFLAKIVFNVAAKINGYDAIIDTQFETIRNAIYTGENINKYVYMSNGTFPLNKIFENLEGISFDEKTCHFVRLFIQDNTYYGVACIYGVNTQYIVKLIENIRDNFHPKTDLYVCDWKNGFEGSNIDIAKKYCEICDEMEK